MEDETRGVGRVFNMSEDEFAESEQALDSEYSYLPNFSGRFGAAGESGIAVLNPSGQDGSALADLDMSPFVPLEAEPSRRASDSKVPSPTAAQNGRAQSACRQSRGCG